MTQQRVEKIDGKHRPVAGDRDRRARRSFGPSERVGVTLEVDVRAAGMSADRLIVGRMSVTDEVELPARRAKRQQPVQNAPGRAEVTTAGRAFGSLLQSSLLRR